MKKYIICLTLLSVIVFIIYMIDFRYADVLNENVRYCFVAFLILASAITIYIKNKNYIKK